jgi:hypothetical protein
MVQDLVFQGDRIHISGSGAYPALSHLREEKSIRGGYLEL